MVTSAPALVTTHERPGVTATGDTVEECIAEMASAIAFHIEGMRAAGEHVPPPTTRWATVDVAA